MNTVIVPLDGSVEAELALPHACQVAGEAPVLLLTSTWHGEPAAPRCYLEQRAMSLVGARAESRVILDELPADAVADALASRPGALVCMATHGRNTLGQAALGSTAEELLRITDKPVLLVGPRAVFDPVRAAASTVILAVDGPDTARALAPAAAAFARRHQLNLWTVQVDAPAPFPFVADAATASQPRQGPGLDAAIEAFEREHITTETELLFAMDPADAIIHFAEKVNASYAIVGNHAREGLARIALGNTAMRVVHRAPCPVLVVRQ